MDLPLAQLDALIRRGLAEDLPFGDVTTAIVLPDPLAPAVAEAVVKGREMVAAGLAVPERVFRALDPQAQVDLQAREGQRLPAGSVLLRARGTARALLGGERLALNLLQRLSGIATLTAEYVRAVEGTGARILDTRKTTPGLRALEKYAVAVGGGCNHRFSLSDGLLIKENHLAAAGGVARAVAAARQRRSGHLLRIEVEVTCLEEAREALEAGADMLLLDNFSPAAVRAAVDLAGGRVPLEVSGGVDLESVRRFAEAGADFISVGRLTHSAPAADISLLFVGRGGA